MIVEAAHQVAANRDDTLARFSTLYVMLHQIPQVIVLRAAAIASPIDCEGHVFLQTAESCSFSSTLLLVVNLIPSQFVLLMTPAEQRPESDVTPCCPPPWPSTRTR